MQKKPKEPAQFEKFVILKKEFDESGRGVSKYARVKELDQQTLFYVLRGQRHGRSETKEGRARDIFRQLKKDKLWRWKFPWEEREWIVRSSK